jgi:hypothetical protein
MVKLFSRLLVFDMDNCALLITVLDANQTGSPQVWRRIYGRTSSLFIHPAYILQQACYPRLL